MCKGCGCVGGSVVLIYTRSGLDSKFESEGARPLILDLD